MQMKNVERIGQHPLDSKFDDVRERTIKQYAHMEDGDARIAAKNVANWLRPSPK